MAARDNALKHPVGNLLTGFIFISVFGLILTVALFTTLWKAHCGILHAVSEMVCVIIAFSAFLIVWNSHERSSREAILLSYGLLAAALLGLLHIFYFAHMGSITARYQGLSSWFAYAGRLAESSAFLLAAVRMPRLKAGKWSGMAAALTLTLGVMLTLLFFAALDPGMFHSEAAGRIMIICSLLILTNTSIALYRFSRRINVKDVIAYKYLFMALIASAVVEIATTLSAIFFSYVFLYAHFVKVISYYYIYKGVFVSMAHYPYDRLAETNERIERVLNSLPIGLITYDRDRRANFVNDAAAALLGMDKEEIYGQSLKDATGAEACDAAQECAVACGIGKKIFMNVQAFEGGMLAVFRDAKKEQDLKNIQLQTKAILNAINQPLVLLDKNKNTTLINKCLEEMIEIDGSAYLNLEIMDCLKRLKLMEFNKTKKYTGLDLQYSEYDIKLEKPEGACLEVKVRAYPIFDIEEETIGWIVVGTDMSRLQEEQHRMQQQEKLALIGQMAAGIVHEIKNPLATIKGFNQMIKLKIQDERIQKYTQTVENAINDLSKVANEFLNFAKPKQRMEGEVLLNRLVESMQMMVCSHTFSKGIRTSFVFSEQEKPVMGDENQIKQVILNLCENAIDALAETKEPQLTIMTLYDESAMEMHIIIDDNGKGMTPAVKAKLGTPFFTTKEKGTGLGLSVCKQIISKHNGFMEFTSEPDKGTRFVIMLPCSSKKK